MKRKIMNLTKWLIITVFVVFLGWRIFELVKKDSSGSGWGFGSAVAVITENVKREDIQDVGEFSGTAYADYQYNVASKVSGRLKKLYVEMGDKVSENQIIAELDDEEYRQSFLEAKANLASANANLSDAKKKFTIAETDRNQAESLFKNGFLSVNEKERILGDFVTAESDLEQAKAQVEQRKAALKLAEIKLNYTVLRASKPGFISKVYIDEGNLVSTNTNIASVVGMDVLRIRSNIVEKLYGTVKIGQKAMIKSETYANTQFEGYVSRIAPVIDEETRMAEMEIEVENTDHRLKPGMFCSIEIILSHNKNAQTIPSKALIKQNGNFSIFVVDEAESKAVNIPVKIGISNEERTEILTPEIKRPIITLGQFQVKDGTKVNITNQNKSVVEEK